MFGNEASGTKDEPAGDGVVDLDAERSYVYNDDGDILRLAYRLYRPNQWSSNSLKVWRTTLL